MVLRYKLGTVGKVIKVTKRTLHTKMRIAVPLPPLHRNFRL